MRNSLIPTTLVAALSLFAITLSSGAALAQKKEEKEAEAKAVVLTVVQVDSETKIIEKSGLKTLKAEADRTYKRALAEYNTAVKNAKKDKTKVTTPKPTKQKIKILKASCKSREEAEAFVASLAKKSTKGDKKRTTKKPKETKEPKGDKN